MTFWKVFAPRRRVDFFEILEKQAEKTLETCQALVDFLEGVGDPEKVKRREQEADDVRRVLIDELNQTFITPMDREDIFELSAAIDDVADYAKDTMRGMQAFEVNSNPDLQQMAVLLVEGSQHLHNALHRLKHNPNVATEYAVKIKRTENKMNRLVLASLKTLFKQDDMHLIFSLREIYRHLNRGADRLDAAANIINTILVKLS